jgi:hypothetical protein
MCKNWVINGIHWVFLDRSPHQDGQCALMKFLHLYNVPVAQSVDHVRDTTF